MHAASQELAGIPAQAKARQLLSSDAEALLSVRQRLASVASKWVGSTEKQRQEGDPPCLSTLCHLDRRKICPNSRCACCA